MLVESGSECQNYAQLLGNGVNPILKFAAYADLFCFLPLCLPQHLSVSVSRSLALYQQYYYYYYTDEVTKNVRYLCAYEYVDIYACARQQLILPPEKQKIYLCY